MEAGDVPPPKAPKKKQAADGKGKPAKPKEGGGKKSPKKAGGSKKQPGGGGGGKSGGRGPETSLATHANAEMPPDESARDKLSDDQLAAALIKEREKRIFWEKQRKQMHQERVRLEKIRAYHDAIESKMTELDVERELLQVEGVVIEQEFRSQKMAQRDKFCQRMCELERVMDNKDTQWYLHSCELRDEDVIATNEHLEREDEVQYQIDEIKRDMAGHMARLKAEKQAFQRKTKIEQIHRERIEALTRQLEEKQERGSHIPDAPDAPTKETKAVPSAHYAAHPNSRQGHHGPASSHSSSDGRRVKRLPSRANYRDPAVPAASPGYQTGAGAPPHTGGGTAGAAPGRSLPHPRASTRGSGAPRPSARSSPGAKNRSASQEGLIDRLYGNIFKDAMAKTDERTKERLSSRQSSLL